MREEKMDGKKKKKGMSLVIAVTPPSPKSPQDTATPEAMKKAFEFLKDYNQMGVGAGTDGGSNFFAMGGSTNLVFVAFGKVSVSVTRL